VAAHAPADLVFVDESGANVKMGRADARAPRGERAVGRVPRNHGTPTSVVAALTPDGLRATATRRGAFTTASFAADVRDVLCPTLRPGQVVVLDNLSAHTSAAVRDAIAAAGCTVLFLPPDSPDVAPIELAWAQVKAALRAAAARTQEASTPPSPPRCPGSPPTTPAPSSATAATRLLNLQDNRSRHRSRNRRAAVWGPLPSVLLSSGRPLDASARAGGSARSPSRPGLTKRASSGHARP
jgi:transposase